MSRSQNTPRESLTVRRLEFGTSGTGVLITDSTGNLRISKGILLSGETTDAITQNTTAVFLTGGLALSGESTDVITQNSTAVFLAGGLAISGEATDVITQNSTSVNFAGGIKVSGQANGVMTALSTGVVLSAIKIGAHWLSANSTGLLIGAAQISTA